MHYALCLAVVLLSFTLHAADLPIPHTGTPRVFTEKERAQIDKYLQGVHNHTAHRFGEQMGFGPVRMIQFQPSVLFHWLDNPRMTVSGITAGKDIMHSPEIELLGRVDQAAAVVYKNPLPTAKGADHLRDETYDYENGKARKVTPPPAGKLKDLPTRLLLPAEIAGLKKLQAGETLYWEQTGDDIRAVGALIAKKDCAECHATKENALLGALTYRFSTDLILKQIRMIEEYEAKDAELRKNRLK
jgi:hypothetical protein